MNGNRRTTADLIEDLRFMERSLTRLTQSFNLEKEAALPEGEKTILAFRDRSRTHYQPVLLRMTSNLKQLRYSLSRMDSIPYAIFLRLEALENKIKETRASFVGTPNRLLRVAGQNTGEE